MSNMQDAFPLVSTAGQVIDCAEEPSNVRPWIMQFAVPVNCGSAVQVPAARYDDQLQVSVGLFGGEMPCMGTHSPTIPDGDSSNPPPLDEGPKD